MMLFKPDDYFSFVAVELYWNRKNYVSYDTVLNSAACLIFLPGWLASTKPYSKFDTQNLILKI